VTSIGGNAFLNCSSLEKIYNYSEVTIPVGGYGLPDDTEIIPCNNNDLP